MFFIIILIVGHTHDISKFCFIFFNIFRQYFLTWKKWIFFYLDKKAQNDYNILFIIGHKQSSINNDNIHVYLSIFLKLFSDCDIMILIIVIFYCFFIFEKNNYQGFHYMKKNMKNYESFCSLFKFIFSFCQVMYVSPKLCFNFF